MVKQPFSRRTLTPEQMDDPSVDRAGLAEALRFLRFVNRRLGGASAALRQFKIWARQWKSQEVIRILDVGTGSADIPVALAAWAKGEGLGVHITGVDLHATTVQLAREFARESAVDDIEIIQADALKLMDIFKPGEFDYAHAGLFLHHLSDLEVMTVLRIMDRLSRRGLIWNDLVRGMIARLGMRLLALSPRVPVMAKHDGLVSVEAGFTRREVFDLARRAGLSNFQYRNYLWHRFTLVSSKE